MRRLSTIRADVLHAAADLEILAAKYAALAGDPARTRTEAIECHAEAARLRSAAAALSRVGYGL